MFCTAEEASTVVYKELRRKALGRAADNPFQGHREPPVYEHCSYFRTQGPLITSFSLKYYAGMGTVRNRVGGRS